jgi:hypothetical protein
VVRFWAFAWKLGTKARAVERFRRLISTMAAVVHPV